MQEKVYILIAAAAIMFAVIGGLSLLAHYYTLNGIKSRTVGDGQHGTARFATKKEIQRTYKRIPFHPEAWRKNKELPQEQGIILGSVGKKNEVTALVDTDDVHTLMIGASGVGKTAFFLYPNLEYACASGMSFLCTDTKGDLFRNYGAVARDHYGYNIAVIDLRNPTRSDGNNLLHLVNKYMDEYRADERSLAAKAKAEKYAKIISKTIINSSGDSANYGQNAFFYDAAEGLLTSVILLLAEFLAPDDDNPEERRHIISVFKMVQELLEPSKVKGKSQFQLLMAKLPAEHKAKWFAGAALNSSEQAMASVMSTVLSRLNAFLDSEMEQILCFDTAIDAEKFCNTKSAIFIVLPEEDLTKYFMVSLMIQQLYREILSVADENGGKLNNRVVFYCDELGTIPPIESLQLIFSASRSRRLLMVPIIQSFGQLQKNYGKEGSEIIVDNCQCTIFGGFAPNSQTADVLSKALGSRTVMSGSISRGKNDPSQSLQMMERPLMMPDELKSLPKGQFVVMKTGTHPMQTRLRLFLDWGITFDSVYEVPEKAERKVAYADKDELEQRILTHFHAGKAVVILPRSLFYTTDISVTLWILNKNKRARVVEQNGQTKHYRNREKEILFMDLRQMGSPFEKKYIELTEEDRAKVTAVYHSWQQEGFEETYQDVPEFCHSASFDEVKEKGFTLVPSRYIEFINRDENIDFDTKMKSLQAELKELLVAEEESKAALLTVFKELGYEIEL